MHAGNLLCECSGFELVESIKVVSMKEGKYFKKKEIDLSKVSILVLTQDGKLKLRLYAKKSLGIIFFLILFFLVIFIVRSFNVSEFNKRKQVCDNLVSVLIFEEKEALRLKEIAREKEFVKKHGMLQVEGREYLDYTPHSITKRDRVMARRSIPECSEIYENGFDN